MTRRELFQFLWLNHRCNEHHLPCNQCIAKSTLHNTEGSKNVAIIKKRKSKMWTDKIHDNLYLVNNKVQMRIPENVYLNSTCFLRLLKEDIQSIKKLEFNTRLQLKNFIALSEQLLECKIRRYGSFPGQILHIYSPGPPRTQFA